MPKIEPKLGRRYRRVGPLESLDPKVIGREFDERREQLRIDERTMGMTDDQAAAFEADLILKERALRERLMPSSFPKYTDELPADYAVSSKLIICVILLGLLIGAIALLTI